MNSILVLNPTTVMTIKKHIDLRFMPSDLMNRLNGYLGLDTRYFAKGGFWGMVQQIIGIGSGLVISFLFGHFVQKRIFGEYNLVLSILSLLSFLSLPGIGNALLQSVGQGFDASLIHSQRAKARFSLLAVPILWIIALYYFNTGHISVAIALFCVSFFFPFLYSFTIFQDFLTAKKQFKTLAFVGSLSSIVFLLSLGISIFFSPTTVGLVLGYMVGIIIPSWFIFRYCQRFVSNHVHVDPDLKSYGSFLTLLSVLPWIAKNLGSIILANIVGTESLATYSVAMNFLASAQKNFTVFYKPITAKLSGQSSKGHSETLKNHGLKLLLIGAFMTAAMWLILPFLILFFFTKIYQDAIFYGRILSLALLPMPMAWVLSDMMIYQKKRRLQIIMSFVPQILMIILYPILIPLWGITGFVIIILIDRYLELFIPLFFLRKTFWSNL